MVKPFGFELDDKRVKRAGLDYWQYLSLTIYENKEEFLEVNKHKKMAFLSSHGAKDHWDIDFTDDMFLVFGKESTGLSKDILAANADQLFKIPIYNERIRSLNLANAVGIIVYEGLRKLR